MARQIQEFRIFLASPGDVQAERAAVRTAAEEVNRTLGNHRGFILKVVGWDTDSRPSYGTDPQNWINLSIGQMADYELFVGILWKRFGAETPRAGSGTEEEFNRAVEAHDTQGRPEIMLYAGQMPFNPTKTDLEQKGKILDFLARVGPKGMYRAYSTTTEFERDFRRHLEDWVLGRLKEEAPEPPRASLSQSAGDNSPNAVATSKLDAVTPSLTVQTNKQAIEEQWVLLGDDFFSSRSVSDKGNGIIVLELLPQDAEEDAALRELQRANQGGYHHSPVPFAHGNDGGIARVESAESMSSGGEKIWTITLRVQQTTNSPMGEPTLNGVTPDQAAELRAKLLLLNQPIQVDGARGGMHDMVIRMIISSMKVREGVFPGLWKRFGTKPLLFLSLARLWAVYILKTSNICEHILELQLTLMENNQALDVVFRGRRARLYPNRPPSVVSLSGRCLLISN